MDTNKKKLSVASLFNKLVGEKAIKNAVVKVRKGDDSFEWSHAVGMQDADASTAMSTASPFYIGGITKMFIATLTMIMHEEKTLRLDDRISEYLPDDLLVGLHRYDGRDWSKELRVFHLLGHTSGLGDYFSECTRGDRTIEQQVIDGEDPRFDLDYVREIHRRGVDSKAFPAPQEGEGGLAYYSDTNYQLLGAILEEAGRRRLSDLLDRYVLDRINLRDTYLWGGEGPMWAASQVPAPVYYEHTPLSAQNYFESAGADGGMVSTVEDQLIFMKALFSSRFFEHKSTLYSMFQWNRIFKPFNYGYGLMHLKPSFFMMPFGNKIELYGHMGVTGAFSFYCPQNNSYVSGTINQLALRDKPIKFLLALMQTV